MKRRMSVISPTQPTPSSPGAELSEAAIDAFLGDRDPAEVFHDEGLFMALRKKVAERALQAELDFHLEGSSDGNTRNGYNRKTVHTEHGSLPLAVPRDRLGSFRPQLVEPWCRRLEGFDDLVLSLFASGLSMRAIRDQIAAKYGAGVSRELVSKITDELYPEIREWQSRPLPEVFALLFLDAIHIRMREDGAVRTKAVHLAIGVDCSGHKHVLGIWIGQAEGARFWLEVLKELQMRGVKDVLIAVTDALAGFPEAIGAVFPEALVQTCIVHLLRNSLAQVSWRERRAVAASLKAICRAPSAEAALAALRAFESSPLGRKHPAIARSWHAHWEEVIPFLSFTQPVRKLTCTTNAIESLNSCVRRTVKSRGHFPSDSSATKLACVAVRQVERKWKKPPAAWHKARREFAILFEDRFQVLPR